MSEQVEQQESVTINLASGAPSREREPVVGSRFVTMVDKYKENLLERPIRYDILSIIFTVLIFIGGIVGYLTKNSVPSLVSGVIFTFLLAAGTYFEGSRKNPYLLLVTLFALAGVMVYRYVQSFNFMPAGLIGLLTIIMLARHGYLLYLKKRSTSPATGQSASSEAQQSVQAEPQSE